MNIITGTGLLEAQCFFFLAFYNYVWSLSQNCPILDIPLHYDWVQCVKFSPSGLHLLSSSFTESIVLLATCNGT